MIELHVYKNKNEETHTPSTRNQFKYIILSCSGFHGSMFFFLREARTLDIFLFTKVKFNSIEYIYTVQSVRAKFADSRSV